MTNSPSAPRVHQAEWPRATIPGSSPARTTTAKLEVLDRALAELRGAQATELRKASSAELAAWQRKAIDAVERYRAHLARKALLEGDQEALAKLSPTDIEDAGVVLAKASISGGLARRVGSPTRRGLR
jgi:acyl-CoA reductase-like NAD-dependent aldehyde dehydrogenase